MPLRRRGLGRPARVPLGLALFLRQPESPIPALLPVQREVAGHGAAPVKERQREQLVAKDAAAKHMVEHAAQTLDARTGLLYRRVIDDVAARSVRLHCSLLADYRLEAARHGEEEAAPVHALAVHQAVEAVLSGIKQAVKPRRTHGTNALAADAEQHEGHNQAGRAHAALLLRRQAR